MSSCFWIGRNLLFREFTYILAYLCHTASFYLCFQMFEISKLYLMQIVLK